MIRITKYLKPYILSIIAILVLIYVQVMANLALPDYMAQIVDKGIVAKDQALILSTGGTMLLVALVGGICTIIAGYLGAKVATAFARDVRAKVFSKVEAFSLNEFNQFSTSSLVTRSTNDITQVQNTLVMILRMVVMAPMMAIGGLVKANSSAPSMSWIMAVAVIALLTMIVVIFSLAIPRFEIIQKLTDKLNLVARENLTGLRVIRAFNTEKYEENKFAGVNQELTDVNLFVNRLMAFFQPIMTLIMSLASLAIIWFGAHLINTGDLQIGNMIAFMQYAFQVIISFLLLSIVFIVVPRASVSARRIMEVLDVDPAIVDPENPEASDAKKKGVVEFKDVTFSYNQADTPVLQNISFTAIPGQTTAIIGSTGSGKSTLINLIPRFYDVSSGEVLVDGVDVRKLKQSDLHDKLGYVPQKAVLFSGTVSSNIKYGLPEALEKDIVNAADIAQASEFIARLPEQYNTPISQGGINVSGGQKQRLSIARATIKKPEIYIFDDSFSALDFKTDAALRQALEEKTKGATVIIVAQRISTILHADKIIVLDEGKIVGEGTHKELLNTSQVYKEIALSQLSEKELQSHLELDQK